MGAMSWRFLSCLLLLTLPLAAQDDELPPDEVAELVDRYVERGQESLREGNYEEARLRFGKALKRDPQHATARLGIAACYRALGAYDKAETEITQHLALHPGDRAGRAALAELDLARGRLAETCENARKVLEVGGEGPDLVGLEARLLMAEALARRGQRDEARTVLDFFLDYHEKRMDSWSDANVDRASLKHRPAEARPLSRELTLVAHALRLYVQLSPLDQKFLANANELILLARELDPDNWEAWTEWVRIRRGERGGAIAAARLARDTVTPKNPELADLWTEVAKSILTGFSSAEARAMAETALKVNPRQTDARAVVARVALEDNEYAVAEEQIDAGLKVDPNHRDLLALKATLDLLLGDEEGFEAGMKRMLEVDPTYGEGFHLAGLVVAGRQRRYDRAVELVRRGLKLDPTNWQAHASLGIFLANDGRAEEALAALKESRRLFPYEHPLRENFRTVLEYVTQAMSADRTEHFVIRFDPGEHEVLSQFLPELLEACYADLTKRYGFEPKVPILVEIFPKADDFSVRTLGLPGIPALGACFGGLITLDSPQALPEGQFLWASTARHEFAHVISLQLSKGQVPRWFTEGLSVLEEKPLDVGWGMEGPFEKQVYDAWATGTLPPVGTFDAMFRTERVAFAYYVGGLMLEFLQEHSGEKGIVEALRLYGEDRPMEEVFQKAFGLELAQFDEKFAAFIAERVKGYHLVPSYVPVMNDLRARAVENPDDAQTQLKLAWAHLQRGELIDAGARYERARRNLKVEETPLAILLEAQLARHAGQGPKMIERLNAFFAAGGEDYEARLLLAEHYRRQNDETQMVAQLEKAREDWPIGVEPLVKLRQHYLAQGRDAEALHMLEARARIQSKSIPMRLELAREYTARGRDGDAVAALEEALRANVFNREVHEALLPLYRKLGEKKKAVRAARCAVALRAEQDADVDQAERWLTLAEVLIEDGNKVEAAQAVAEALKLVEADELPRLPAIREKLGQ